jgi:predicted ester cyclase
VTVPFQAVARGVDKARAQFTNFLRAFPDYHVELDVLRAVEDMVFSSGAIRATMQGPLAGVEPTGQQYALPFACYWKIRDSLIVHVAFFYDFNQMCEQLGLDVSEPVRKLAVASDGSARRGAAHRITRCRVVLGLDDLMSSATARSLRR